ncbi:hypothetical protein F4805DRAFT_389944 [Annulohypoxylon moriforme]|nr:hypothetical protein F4805DRAFT_389944 [Annulohypoxylon moriforme]
MRPKKGRRILTRPPKLAPDYGYNNKPFAEFAEFVDNQAKQHVEEFSEDNKKFIPFPILRDYWKIAKVRSILNTFDPPLPFCIDTIRDGYIRVFSMLVYCGQVANLEHFTRHNLHDSILPLKKRPDDWKGDSFYDNLFGFISKYQWMFFPLTFAPTYLEDCYLDSNQILPIVKLERITHDRITQGDAAIIQKMAIHESCHSLSEEGQPNPNTFVLKTYHKHRYQRLYENEVDALRTLKNSRSPNVIKYYGSFRQNGTYNIILEYADGGDLAEFLKKTPRPKGDEVIQFWRSMSLCFRGLQCIHRLMNTSGNNLNGIHEDIKPENILIFKGPSGSPYDFVPKIADFGLFTRVRGSKASSIDAMGRDRIGNQFYSSPETSHHASYHENTPNAINTRADIFSFGTVLSEASAWVKGGHDEIRRYYERRKACHQTIRAFRGNDYEGCFHDGVKRLPIVDKTHTSIRDHCKSSHDLITPRVLDIIENFMLLSNANSRSNARQLEERFQQIFDTPNREILNILPSTPTSESTPVEKQGLSLAKLGEYMTRRQSTTSREGSDYQTSMRIEIEKLMKDLDANVPDRHHMFFIDDSTSMKEHKESIEEAFAALLHLTRRLEGHKVELSFASGPRRPCCKRRSKKLRQLVARREYQRDPDMMENRFRRLVDDVIIPRLPNHVFGININIRTRKPTSIYVFTDGNWREDDDFACGVEKHIKRLRQELDKRGLDRNHISFHFVRLGDHANGRKFLNYLDRFGRNNEQDNVDVKTMSSSVKSILIGPLSQSNDDSDEEEDDDM